MIYSDYKNYTRFVESELPTNANIFWQFVSSGRQGHLLPTEMILDDCVVLIFEISLLHSSGRISAEDVEIIWFVPFIGISDICISRSVETNFIYYSEYV